MDRDEEIQSALAEALLAIDDERSAIDLVAEIPLIEAAADAIIRARIDTARAQGLSWEAIAQRLGMSRQAAHKRFGRSKGRAADEGGIRLELRVGRSKKTR